VPLHSFAVCSDAEVGKKRNKDEDVVEVFTHELRYPATTDARRLAEEVKKRHDTQHMSVIFSTYHSLDVISRAQLEYGLPDFQLVICDEAHRTTGATFDSESEPRRRRKRTTSRCARWMMRRFTASSFTSSRHRATVYSVEKRISNRVGERV
jgi:predicted helicase